MIKLFLPTIIDKSNNKDYAYDLFSRLLKDRIILLSGEINDDVANMVVAQLLYLDAISNNDISIYINSPGGSVSAGLERTSTRLNSRHIQNARMPSSA